MREESNGRLKHPKAHLLQVSGVKAISHAPDRDRMPPMAPEGDEREQRGKEATEEGEEKAERWPDSEHSDLIEGSFLPAIAIFF